MKIVLNSCSEDLDSLQSRALKYEAEEVLSLKEMDYANLQFGIVTPLKNHSWTKKIWLQSLLIT
ncbi:MAG: hypothetical protein ACI8UX_001611 [Psychromonas sp.]|jgi:hypothetical protein